MCIYLILVEPLALFSKLKEHTHYIFKELFILANEATSKDI